MSQTNAQETCETYNNNKPDCDAQESRCVYSLNHECLSACKKREDCNTETGWLCVEIKEYDEYEGKEHRFLAKNDRCNNDKCRCVKPDMRCRLDIWTHDAGCNEENVENTRATYAWDPKFTSKVETDLVGITGMEVTGLSDCVATIEPFQRYGPTTMLTPEKQKIDFCPKTTPGYANLVYKQGVQKVSRINLGVIVSDELKQTLKKFAGPAYYDHSRCTMSNFSDSPQHVFSYRNKEVSETIYCWDVSTFEAWYGENLGTEAVTSDDKLKENFDKVKAALEKAGEWANYEVEGSEWETLQPTRLI